MVSMTIQPTLPIHPAEAFQIGAAAALLEDAGGGKVFIHGNLAYAWAAGDEVSRRLAAVQLANLKAASTGEIAAAFSVGLATVFTWRRLFAESGAQALVPGKRGPKGPSKLTAEAVAEIRRLRADGLSLARAGAAVGVSEFAVRRALGIGTAAAGEPAEPVEPAAPDASVEGPEGHPADVVQEELPVLPAPVDRSAERAAARTGLLEAAEPVFAPAARAPLAGLFLSLPALETTGLLPCAQKTHADVLGPGFYGLESVLLDAVFRTLAGEPRAEGATRFDPAALGRILGLDRGPEVKTVRRKFAALAGAGKAADLLQSMAATHLEDLGKDTGLLLYVDGHVRSYYGTRKIAKNHSTRMKFPVPATVETWVNDAHGDPVLVIMAEPGASLAMELRRLLPRLRTAVGDDRRILVGFDRGGWSPALFAHMDGQGFDTLTWRKGRTEDIDPELFISVAFTDPETGLAHEWEAADTMVELPVGKRADAEVFAMRQITRLVDTGKDGKGKGRQIHLLTTRTDLTPGELLYRMGARWRQENHFRYGRMRFDLDSHDCYATTDDDGERTVPNPAKKKAADRVAAARNRAEHAGAATDAALLAARTPGNGTAGILITNEDYNLITAPLRAAETALEDAKAASRALPMRVALKESAPGQQVLDTEIKLLTHAVKIAAYNTDTALARSIRTNTGCSRAADEAHALVRQLLIQSGDIDPREDGYLTIRLDPLPTARATKAAAELCEHLTATLTKYPGTGRILRYEIKTADNPPIN